MHLFYLPTRNWFQHTAARRRLAVSFPSGQCVVWFQHTAARRRLGKLLRYQGALQEVSTHSRPKAAGHKFTVELVYWKVSTHSRPKAAGIQPSQGLHH